MAPEGDGSTESDKVVDNHPLEPGASDDNTVLMGVDLRQLPTAIGISGHQLFIIFLGLALLIRFGPSALVYWTTEDVHRFPGCVRPRPTFEGPAGQVKWGLCGDPDNDFYPFEVQCGHAMFVIHPNASCFY